MALLKRFELWVLVALIVAGVVFVFSSRQRGEGESSGQSAGVTTPGDSDAPLKLHRCILKRDYGTARLDIELKVRNDDTRKLIMQTPAVQLIAAKGREVPGFYLPFEPAPEIAGNTTQDMLLRYWLTAEDLEGALALNVTGKTVQVKGAKPFRLEDIPNLTERTFQAGEW